MGTMAMASATHRLNYQVAVGSLPSGVRAHSRLLCVSLYPAAKFARLSSLSYCRSSNAGTGALLRPVSAVGSGLEASITDPKGKLITVKDIEVVVESKDDDKMQVRVDVSGEDTQIVFEKILRSLARTAPPVPGFRREKGGKTSKVPKDLLLRILGEDRVTNFVIQELISIIVADYVKKENLTIKENKIFTIQTAEELKSAFTPGSEFGFNVTMELEKSSVSPANCK